MDPNAETPGAEVAEDPTPADQETGAEETTPENDTEASSQKADTQPPAGEKPAGDTKVEKPAEFGDLFGKAKETALSARDEEGKQAKGDEGGESKSGDESEKKPADEQIPAEEDKTKPEEETAKAEDTGEEGDKKPDRTRNYKAIVEENTALKTERDTAIEKVTKLDAKLSEHGGIEVVTQAMDIFDKLANGKAAEVIAELPAHQKQALQKQVFETALTNEANRVFGVNQVLKSDFGLANDMSQPQLEKVFEYVTHRLNTDAEGFEALIDRELEYANTPENENAKLKAEIERLKTKPAETAKADGTEETPETDDQLLTRISTTHDDFESTTFKTLLDPELKTYGLEVSAKDTPAVKEAKEELIAMVREKVGHEMRLSKAFEPLLPLWATKETENTWYNQAARAYERAMKAKIQQSLKKISKLFVAKAQPVANGNGADAGKTALPAPGGKGSNIQRPAKKQGEGGGFTSAFAAARKAVQN